MDRAKCPLCKGSVVIVSDVDVFGIPGRVIMYHCPARRGTPTRTGFGPEVCLGTCLTLEYAAGVAADLEAGIMLASHP